MMKFAMKRLEAAGYAVAVAALLPVTATQAAEGNAEKPKPYPLNICVVSGEKFGGDMGDPYVFTYQGREIKLCCKSCLKDFNKEPAKFLKKLDAAQKNTPNREKSGSPANDHGAHNH